MPAPARLALVPAATPAAAPLPSFGTEHDAAALLGLSAETLRTWRTRRRGPPCWRRFGRSIRYDLQALAAWAEAQHGGATSSAAGSAPSGAAEEHPTDAPSLSRASRRAA